MCGKNCLYITIIIYKEIESLKFYLNHTNNDVTRTNDKDQIEQETYKVVESESVDSSDVHESEPKKP